jgi:hypothetical protein
MLSATQTHLAKELSNDTALTTYDRGHAGEELLTAYSRLVAALRLEDIDWEVGLITIRGKGKRVVQMHCLSKWAPRWPTICAMPGRIVPVVASSSDAKRRWPVSPIPSPSVRWWTGLWKKQELSPFIEAPTCSVTA